MKVKTTISWIKIFFLILFLAGIIQKPSTAQGPSENAELIEVNLISLDQIGNEKRAADEIKLEVISNPVRTKKLAGKNASGMYVRLSVKISYARDESWEALDKGSFELVNWSDEGQKKWPLDYVTSTLFSKRSSVDTILEELVFPKVYTYIIVFDVDSDASTGWFLRFMPHERGKTEPLFITDIPLSRIY